MGRPREKKFDRSCIIIKYQDIMISVHRVFINYYLLLYNYYFNKKYCFITTKLTTQTHQKRYFYKDKIITLVLSKSINFKLPRIL